MISQHMFLMKWGNWAEIPVRYRLCSSSKLKLTTKIDFACAVQHGEADVSSINEQLCPPGKQYYQPQMLKEQKIEWQQ